MEIAELPATFPSEGEGFDEFNMAPTASSTEDLGSVQDPMLEEPVAEAPVYPTLQNIVATCNVGVELNLKRITQHSRNAEYNPKRFAAVVMRIREPKTTALIFGSGKIVVTGAKNEEQSHQASRRYARIIQKTMGPEVEFKEFKVQNVVASIDVKFPIRLEGLVAAHGNHATYEPELFPGLIYRMSTPVKLTLLVFVSGKVVFTGAKRKSDIDKAYDAVLPVLKQFQKI